MSEPLHVTFICSGNICRSPMAEKMFAHQISERGLADEVRVTSAGTGDWHAGEGADNRANRVLREHGYPTEHRAAADQRGPSVGRPRGGAGPKPRADAARHGRCRPTGCGCCGRSTRGRVRMRSTSRTPTTARTTTSRTSSPSSRPRCPACTTGWTSSSPSRGIAELDGSAVDRSCCGRGWLALVRRGHRVRLPVLHRAGAVAARQEHQDLPRERTDLAVADGRTGPADKRSATAGFVGTR